MASAVNMATTAAQTEDDTELVDSFIQMQRAKDTPGTVHTADHSSLMTPPMRSDQLRRRSERSSTCLVRTHCPCLYPERSESLD